MPTKRPVHAEEGDLELRRRQHAAAHAGPAPLSQEMVRRAQRDPSRLTPGDVLALQRTMGNRSVAQTLGRTSDASSQIPESLQPHPIVQRQPFEEDSHLVNSRRVDESIDKTKDFEDQTLKTLGFKQEHMAISHSGGRTRPKRRKVGQATKSGGMSTGLEPSDLETSDLQSEHLFVSQPALSLDKTTGFKEQYMPTSMPQSGPRVVLPMDEDLTTDFEMDYVTNYTPRRAVRADLPTYIATGTERSKLKGARSRGYGPTLQLSLDRALQVKEHQFLKSVPVDELKAISFYTGEGYRALNPNMRSDEEIADDAPLLASGLNRFPPVRGTLYRGTLFDYETAKSCGYMNIGGIHTEKAPMSTTIDKRYWPADKNFSGAQIAFQVESKGGGKDVRMVSSEAAEDEVLFGPMSKFKILGVTPWPSPLVKDNVDAIPDKPTVTDRSKLTSTGYKAWIIYLEEMPTPEQREMYRSLDAVHGTVDMNKAVEILNLMTKPRRAADQPMWDAQAASDSTYFDAWLAENSLGGARIVWNTQVIVAIKSISRDKKVADLVIKALQTGGVEGLKAHADHEDVQNLLTRWQNYLDTIPGCVAHAKDTAAGLQRHEEEEARKREEQKRIAAARKRKEEAAKLKATADPIYKIREAVPDVAADDALIEALKHYLREQRLNDPKAKISQVKASVAKIAAEHGKTLSGKNLALVTNVLKSIVIKALAKEKD